MPRAWKRSGTARRRSSSTVSPHSLNARPEDLGYSDRFGDFFVEELATEISRAIEGYGEPARKASYAAYAMGFFGDGDRKSLERCAQIQMRVE